LIHEQTGPYHQYTVIRTEFWPSSLLSNYFDLRKVYDTETLTFVYKAQRYLLLPNEELYPVFGLTETSTKDLVNLAQWKFDLKTVISLKFLNFRNYDCLFCLIFFLEDFTNQTSLNVFKTKLLKFLVQKFYKKSVGKTLKKYLALLRLFFWLALKWPELYGLNNIIFE
jgi:hypothetical protein